ncbi:uncharacterized protein B0I36DRAFT_150274 [Microdochium trichocladiopsis]|uniref:Uncharacterized protein n=1 Tax=Microdochium trichocladiopsis TaxID=1682393 RepID=A0A9P8XZS8_9PEZI|nr:uncharacterized protein B0I36DRAFT_150274 [Microdochium trichocladiopsis]KAH7025881.1 hypothetical protein B0I36DRAFT_150274 [Microdochium trichocladiopsis]
MDDTEVESGLFAIQLSSDDEDNTATGNAQDDAKADRTGQTEEQFQHVRKAYRVKVETGEFYKQIPLPLSSANPSQQQQQLVSKPQAQALLHAVEELYFLRRYDEGAAFVRRIFDESDDDTSILHGTENGSLGGSTSGLLDEDTRKTLRYYQRRCEERSRAS